LAMQLQQDFKELLRLFNENDVKYLIIGGIAVLMHGYARNTVDLDLSVAADQENAEKIVRVLVEFGFGTTDLSTALFTTENSLVRIGVPPVRIEILNYLQGLSFEQAFANRIERNFQGVMVNLISLQDLISNKKAVGRHKDLADVEGLEKMAARDDH